MIEAGLCLALFTPLVFSAVRLAYGANQMHEAASAVSEAARAGGACAAEAEIRRLVVANAPGVRPDDVDIAIDHEAEPATIRVSIRNFRVVSLAGVEPLPQAPAATFPYACD